MVAIADIAQDIAEPQVLGDDLEGSIRLLTCGSVDDGKSTLIGRLLWDASDLYDDQRETLANGRKLGDGSVPDFSLLVDGLAAEREQGITIDIAWRYFDTAKRRFVIIDSPGHEQYTRNMASGASHADVAIMLIDARHGIKRQTKRHAAILDLMGVKRVILAVNKMDLVDWDEATYRAIEADFRKLTWRFGFWDAIAIPLCAVTGDNVADVSQNMTWFDGPTLLEHLEAMPAHATTTTSGPLRMPVQTVLRDSRDFRGLAGTISAGSVSVGDDVIDVLSGRTAKVKRIATMDGDLTSAQAGQAVVIEVDIDLDIARGAVLSSAEKPATAASHFDVRFVWLSEDAFNPKAGYLLRTATDLVPIANMKIKSLLDLETLAVHDSVTCGVNDIAIATIDAGRMTAVDLFGEVAALGCFMIVDAVSGQSVAGGIVTDAHQQAEAGVDDDGHVFELTREALSAGACADLSDSEADRAEFVRRANEIAILMRGAGISVRLKV